MRIQATYAEIRTPAHCNLMKRKMTAKPLVLSPSSILPSPSYHLRFHSRKKNRRAFENVLFEGVLLFKNSVSLKLLNLKMRTSGSDINFTNDSMKPKLYLQGR
jgi:hypothetical protein